MSKPIKQLLLLLLATLLAAAFLTARASVANEVVFQGWLNSCQGLTIRWLNHFPTDQIDHYEIFWNYDGLLQRADGNALSASRLTGCNFASNVLITLVTKAGARYTATSARPGVEAPHSYPCGSCPNAPPSLTAVSAADFRFYVTPNSIASLFTDESAPFSAVTGYGVALPLPTFLFDVQVLIDDAPVGLFFTSPKQINFYVPEGLSKGAHTIRVEANGRRFFGQLILFDNAPAIFTANMNGEGVAAGYVVRVARTGRQTTEPLARFDGVAWQPIPIRNAAEGESIFVVLFGTGYQSGTPFLNYSGREVAASFAGYAPGFVGLNQFNFPIVEPIHGRITAGVRTRFGESGGYWDSNLFTLEFQ